jgi:hypothetical protein
MAQENKQKLLPKLKEVFGELADRAARTLFEPVLRPTPQPVRVRPDITDRAGRLIRR